MISSPIHGKCFGLPYIVSLMKTPVAPNQSYYKGLFATDPHSQLIVSPDGQTITNIWSLDARCNGKVAKLHGATGSFEADLDEADLDEASNEYDEAPSTPVEEPVHAFNHHRRNKQPAHVNVDVEVQA